MNPSRKILIDTDTASDDAIALIMALRSPDVSVLAITVVAGNVSVESRAHATPCLPRSSAAPQFRYSPEQRPP
jgi:inosine-uridine nucleoside N-ribohydrolase